MAESHSEDSPLLGTSSSSDSPSLVPCSPSVSNPSLPQWEVQESFVIATSPGEPPRLERLVVPSGATTPKSVHSQTSMDSGCDCDLAEPADAGSSSAAVNNSRNRSCPSKGDLSPLSPSQRGLSEPCSPPGSSTAAPLAQKESLECQCGGVGQKCICDTTLIHPCTSSSMGGSASRSLLPVIAGGSSVAPLSPPRGGELHSSSSRVTFRIEGYDDGDDSSDERCDVIPHVECLSPTCSEPGEEFRDMVRGASRSFTRVTSYSKSGMLSASSSTASMPMCRICHLPQGEDLLISPCRCRGTMQFIHETCLMKWLEISSKKYKRAAICELCNYQFNRHKKFRLHHWQLPTCSRLDKILHCVFLACLIVMAGCTTITVYCFKQDRFHGRSRNDTDLTRSEIVTLTCGVLFFVAFFLAMYVEVKAKDTLLRLFNSFLYLNQTWHIDEYDKRRDRQLYAPV